MNEISLPNIPTREQIERLQAAMSEFPQTDELKTEHIFHGGMYCRKLFRPAGTVIVGRVHKKEHLFICVAGEIIAWSETGMRVLKPGDVIESMPGTKRATYATQDSIGMTVHRTDSTSLQEIEDELLEPEEHALFNIENKPKVGVPIQHREQSKEVIECHS